MALDQFLCLSLLVLYSLYHLMMMTLYLQMFITESLPLLEGLLRVLHPGVLLSLKGVWSQGKIILLFAGIAGNISISVPYFIAEIFVINLLLLFSPVSERLPY